jgi:hypothetical protein
MPAVEIIFRLRHHYGKDALSRTQIYVWINKIKRGRTDLNNIASLGREPDEGLAIVIAAKLDADIHLSGRKLAQSLRIAASTICRYLTEVSGMKCRHVRCVPTTLTAAQKAVYAELAEFARHPYYEICEANVNSPLARSLSQSDNPHR